MVASLLEEEEDTMAAVVIGVAVTLLIMVLPTVDHMINMVRGAVDTVDVV